LNLLNDVEMSEPKKKRQHFVPKFYLRGFSFDGGNRLHLILADERKAIPRIGLKKQCYEDYFYGKDPKVENALQELEGGMAEVIRGISANQRMPEPGTSHDFVFRTFVCLQWGRTKFHAEMSEAGFDKMLKVAYGTFLRAQGLTQEQIDELRIGTENPGLLSLGMTSEIVPFIGDLGTKLVQAGDYGEFVTSDAPVVLYNPYLLGRYPGCVTGIGTRGLVIFYPISPKLLVVLYDRGCYRVGPSRARIVSISNPDDLVAVNNFQFLHADNTVYFHNEASANEYLKEFEKVSGMRRPDRNVVQEAKSATLGDTSSLLISYRADLPYRPSLTFLSLLRRRRGETGILEQIEERCPEISTLFEH